ncbi:MAG: ArsA family ATPase [Alphaproteobacteria bacterium]|nr:ArsA family ATPase [Alphaproteobacteria bacterium]
MAEPVLDGLLREQRLLLCVGSGGVGKTTVAASLAVQAALRGRRVLVLTIDPARRLANSLGLQRFGNDAVPVALPDGGEPGGSLHAMMLDPHTTIRQLIERVAPDAASAERILHNRIFRAIADSIAGSQEYMATEKLYDVVDSGRYDLVVLDTPPVKNALDFLDAPGRLARFTDRQIMKWFLAPYEEGRGFGRLLWGTSAVVFRLLGYVFGKEFLGELSEFFQAFRDLYDGFRERSEAVVEMFAAPSTRFLVVCAPTASSVDTARFFLGELRQRGLPCAGVVVNQRAVVGSVAPDAEAALGALAHEHEAGLAPHTADALVARLGAADRRLRELAALEQRRLAFVGQAMAPSQSIWGAPRLEGEVHDLDALIRLGGFLTGGAP